MSNNPLLNGCVASLYIIAVAAIMNWGTKLHPRQNSFLAPIAVISLFTLSAAVMGYIFCYRPILLLMEGKKKQGVELFLKTTLIFGGLTMIALFLLFSGML